jgi:2,3-bisphosphoglycerate-dependent phosphoglycerate mutase
MYTLVLLRHGESVFNQENRFTGWTDVDLSEAGRQQAVAAGQLLRREGYTFDAAYCSVLRRTIKTLDLVLDELDLLWIPVEKSWRLNERFYGALQGLNKQEITDRYGAEQVQRWRRDPHEHPPAIDPSDERYPGKDPRYAHLTSRELPLTENLSETLDRVLPLWTEKVMHAVKQQRVLVCAHGNSLRAILQYMQHLSDEAVVQLDIPTGRPLVCELDDNLSLTNSFYL